MSCKRTYDFPSYLYMLQCCRCKAICGEEKPERLTVSGIASGGVRGAMARSEFLMSRKKIVKVKMLQAEGPKLSC